MLDSLHIENMAVIECLDIDFSSGLSVITGETGAGKSVMLDAVAFLLGARPERELLRNGAGEGLVSAVFSAPSAECLAYLREAGFSADDELLLQRTLYADGRSKCRLNGRAVPLAILRELAAYLVSIHGQNDNQRLLLPATQQKILDDIALTQEQLDAYRTRYRAYRETERRIASVQRDAAEAARLADVLRFQIGEIDAAKLKPGEEEALIEHRAKLQNAEKIAKQADFTYRVLYGNEKGNAALLLERAAQAVQQLSNVLPELEKTAEKLLNMRYEVEDIAITARDLTDDIDADPTAALNRVEGRLDTIAKLRRKYGADIPAVLQFRKESAERLASLENAEDRIIELTELHTAQKNELLQLANDMHAARAAAAEALSQNVMRELAFLDMQGVRFAVLLTETAELTLDGADSVEFCIAAEKDAPLLPLSRIASGGELSRIMLAIKSVLNDRDGVPTAVFDEVDTGISGKTSRKIGMKLSEIARSTQVLCVTHSAQIASLADTHWKIEKNVSESGISSTVYALDDEGRVEEVARILGGLSVTEAQRAAARDMIKEGEACR